MKQRVRVLVEGGDDKHFVEHFLKATLHKDIKGDQCGNLEKLLAIAATHVSQESPIGLLAVICDADADPDKRWKEIRQALTESYVPERPDPNGTLVDFSRRQKLAIWMMPDNTGPGAVENFLAEIRVQNEQQSALAAHAKIRSRRFKPRIAYSLRRTKARPNFAHGLRGRKSRARHLGWP